MRPTRNSRRLRDIETGRLLFPIWSCSERGLPCGRAYATPRWSLTPPFHPYPDIKSGRYIFCGTFHHTDSRLHVPTFPRDALPFGVRTFLPVKTGRSIAQTADSKLRKYPAAVITRYNSLCTLYLYINCWRKMHVTTIADTVNKSHNSIATGF